ncbi:MAG: mechanosensitive ion channel domain-containing protein [Nitritalea sp.]
MMRTLYFVLFLLYLTFFQVGPLLSAQTSAREDSIAQAAIPSLESGLRSIQEYTIRINRLNYTLRKELDTLSALEAVPELEGLLAIVSTRLDSASGRVNLRYLDALGNVLVSVRNQTSDIERLVANRVQELLQVRDELAGIKKDPIFSVRISEAREVPEFKRSLEELRRRANESEKLLSKQRTLAASQQARISAISIQLEELTDRITSSQRLMERTLLRKESNYLWDANFFPDVSQLLTVLRESIYFNQFILKRFIREHAEGFVFLSLFFVGFYLLNRWSIQKITSEKDFAPLILKRAGFLGKNPLIATLLIVLPLMPFFFTNPPIVFYSVSLLLSASLSSLLVKAGNSWKAFTYWLVLLVLFLFFTISNLYWEIAYQERWHLILMGILSIFLGIKILQYTKTYPGRLPEKIPYLVYSFIALHGLALLAQILGRFSLGKLLGVAASMSFMQAVCLYIFVQLIMDIVYVQLELGRKNQKDFTSFLDFHGIQKRLKAIFAVVAGFIWFGYFLEYIALRELILSQAKEFLEAPREILKVTFTFGSIFLFILVSYLSVFLANNIAYFATIKDQQQADQREKRLGSSILLIRLAVLTIGFFIAIIVSGISLDKAAIVLGALSVGIGFGLQTIVNNLASGIILAFERPIQIGDTIEVGGRIGTVKEVGVRSSKLQGYDGSEVIIPNGDMLSQHLINWTLSDKKRRVELFIGVAYGSDMDLVTQLIGSQLKMEGILKEPAPKVFMQTFANSAVEFRVLFWVEHIDVWVERRDQVMRAIFRSFKEHDIEIPFPQQDIYIKKFPGLLREEISGAPQLPGDPKKEKGS